MAWRNLEVLEKTTLSAVKLCNLRCGCDGCGSVLSFFGSQFSGRDDLASSSEASVDCLAHVVPPSPNVKLPSKVVLISTSLHVLSTLRIQYGIAIPVVFFGKRFVAGEMTSSRIDRQAFIDHYLELLRCRSEAYEKWL
jgi:hypothetical protein